MATVRELTSLGDEQIDEVLRWWSRQPRKVQLRCVETEQLAELVNQAAKVKALVQAGQQKNYEADPDQNWHALKKVEDLRIESLQSGRRSSPKRSALWQHRSLIKRMLGKNRNYTLVTEYLGKWEKINVTVSYLRRTWLSWEKAGFV